MPIAIVNRHQSGRLHIIARFFLCFPKQLLRSGTPLDLPTHPATSNRHLALLPRYCFLARLPHHLWWTLPGLYLSELVLMVSISSWANSISVCAATSNLTKSVSLQSCECSFSLSVSP